MGGEIIGVGTFQKSGGEKRKEPLREEERTFQRQKKIIGKRTEWGGRGNGGKKGRGARVGEGRW